MPTAVRLTYITIH